VNDLSTFSRYELMGYLREMAMASVFSLDVL